MGCVNANNGQVFYDQAKNAIETYNRYEKANDGLNHWTETCGPTSLWNGCEAMGIDIKEKGFGQLIRPADAIFCYLNNLYNFSKLPAVQGCVPGELPGNEVQAWLPVAMQDLFGVNCVYHEGLSFQDVVGILGQGHAVQLARTVGHFIVAVDYDSDKQEIIYWDSFSLFIQPDGTLVDDGTNGFRRRASEEWFNGNLYSRFIEIVG